MLTRALVLSLRAAAAAAPPALRLAVDPTATSCTHHAPVAPVGSLCSVEAAQAAVVAALRRQPPLPEGQIVVTLAAHTYYAPLSFAEQHSGTPRNPVVWLGHGARVVGGRELSRRSFRPVEPSDPVMRRLSPNTSVVVADLANLNLSQADVGALHEHNRIVGLRATVATPSLLGRPLVLARWPNADDGWASGSGSGPPAVPHGACLDENACRNFTFGDDAPFAKWAARSGDTQFATDLFMTSFVSDSRGSCPPLRSSLR